MKYKNNMKYINRLNQEAINFRQIPQKFMKWLHRNKDNSNKQVQPDAMIDFDEISKLKSHEWWSSQKQMKEYLDLLKQQKRPQEQISEQTKKELKREIEPIKAEIPYEIINNSLKQEIQNLFSINILNKVKLNVSNYEKDQSLIIEFNGNILYNSKDNQYSFAEIIPQQIGVHSDLISNMIFSLEFMKNTKKPLLFYEINYNDQNYKFEVFLAFENHNSINQLISKLQYFAYNRNIICTIPQLHNGFIIRINSQFVRFQDEINLLHNIIFNEIVQNFDQNQIDLKLINKYTLEDIYIKQPSLIQTLHQSTSKESDKFEFKTVNTKNVIKNNKIIDILINFWNQKITNTIIAEKKNNKWYLVEFNDRTNYIFAESNIEYLANIHMMTTKNGITGDISLYQKVFQQSSNETKLILLGNYKFSIGLKILYLYKNMLPQLNTIKLKDLAYIAYTHPHIIKIKKFKSEHKKNK